MRETFCRQAGIEGQMAKFNEPKNEVNLRLFNAIPLNPAPRRDHFSMSRMSLPACYNLRQYQEQAKDHWIIIDTSTPEANAFLLYKAKHKPVDRDLKQKVWNDIICFQRGIRERFNRRLRLTEDEFIRLHIAKISEVPWINHRL